MGLCSINPLSSDSCYAEPAAKALDGLTGGLSTKLAGAVFDFDADCTGWGDSGIALAAGFAGLGKFRAGAHVAARSQRTAIGKVRDLENLGPGENTLLKHLPNQGSPKANWKQNSGVLRREMGKGRPIRDASVDPQTGQLVEYPGSFLNAERALLRERGWTYDPSSRTWNPPR